MNIDARKARGLGWGDDKEERPRPGRVLPALAAALAMLATLVPSAVATEEQAPAEWIVRAVLGAVDDAARLVERLGGEVVLPLPIINGFSARLSERDAIRLTHQPGVTGVIPDSSITFSTWESGPPSDEGAMHVITQRVIRADRFWRHGFTGDGVDIALVDTGVSPVPGIDDPERVVNGADLSFDSQKPNLLHLDLYGHGTHMASIIAGSDIEGAPRGRTLRTAYAGVAPDARILNVKVGDGAGRADVSQVIAAIDWVVQHRDDPEHDLDVRVLALAFGTDGTQDYLLDPLAHAAEVAWRSGIVVVAAAGNDGNAAPLRNPAFDPYLLSVGAVQTQGTYGKGDDRVLSFSNCGTDQRSVDLLAPGKSVLGLRVPGSFIDTHHPEAVVQDRLFRGSGTSQAAAVTAGAVALLLDQRPELTPDQVKALLMESAAPLRHAPGHCAEAGVLDLGQAFRAPTPQVSQDWPTSTGVGSLEAARGSHHVEDGGVVLEGEIDIFGHPWDGATWAAAASAGNSWSGGVWNGNSWSGNSWSGNSWSGNSWSGNSWSGNSWSGNSWSGNSWSGNSWSGNSWSDAVWNGNSWSGNSWSGNSWSGNSWSGTVWATSTWD